MLKDLLRFEIRFHARQPVFLLLLVLFFALGLLMSRGNFGGSALHSNSPYVITYVLSLTSLFTIFVSTVFCANVVLRDRNHKMEDWVFSSRLTKWQWFFVRLSALVAMVFAVLCLAAAGVLAGMILFRNQQSGTVAFLHYFQPLLLFGLPNVFFCCSIVFAVAVTTENVRAVYAAGVMLFVLYFVGSILGNSPLMAGSSLNTTEEHWLPYLLDPFGLICFFGETRNWSVLERNERLFPLQGMLLLNRIVWIGISLLLLALSYRYFRFTLKLQQHRNKKIPTLQKTMLLSLKPVTVRTTGRRFHFRVFYQQLTLESKALFKHLPFLFMMLLWVVLFAIDLKEEALEGPYGIRYLASTGLIVEKLRSVHPALFLLVFYGAEIIHRERSAGMEGLVFATPAPGIAVWLGKFFTLVLLSVLLVTINILIGFSIQLLTGNSDGETWRYLTLYYYSVVPLCCYAALIVFVLTIFPNKFAGMTISLLLCGLFVFGKTIGLHNLLRFGVLPGLQYSDLNGYGHYAKSVHWYMLYWVIPSIILLLLAGLFRRRARLLRRNENLKLAIHDSGWKFFVPLLLLILCWAGTGAFITARTGTGRPALGGKALLSWRQQYEQRFKSEASLPEPVIEKIETYISLYPEAQRYTVEGKYWLRNKTDQPISKIWVGINRDVDVFSCSVANAKLIKTDTVFGQYWFRPATPLMPGDSSVMQFKMEVNRTGFLPYNNEHSVVRNGSYVELEKYLPFFGYNAGFEIEEPVLRKERGLPERFISGAADSNYHFISYETVISTDSGQQVVTVGVPAGSWHKEGRSYFRFNSERPIPMMLAFSAARYAVRTEELNGTKFNIYYHPGHEKNLPSMMLGLQDAIEYGKTNFCDYPFPNISLAEIPQYRGAATAYPAAIFSAERINFRADHQEPFNATYTVALHEAAHQWWADILSPQQVTGKAFLTESLAKYTEMVVIEKRFGKMLLREYLEKDNRLYFSMRNGDAEPEQPLIRSDQPFAYYQKAGFTLYDIKEMIGDTVMNKALQILLAEFGPAKKRPQPADFLTILKALVNEEQRNLITSRLEKIMVRDAGLQLVSCKPLPGGQYELVLNIYVSSEDQTSRRPVPVRVPERIQIAAWESDDERREPLLLKGFTISRNKETITVTCSRKPAKIMIDPMFGLADPDRKNNILRIP